VTSRPGPPADSYPPDASRGPDGADVLVMAQSTRVFASIRRPLIASSRARTSYRCCVDNAPPTHGGGRPDIGQVEFSFCLLALDWGRCVKQTAARERHQSAKAREISEANSRRIVGSAAPAQQRRCGPRQYRERVVLGRDRTEQVPTIRLNCAAYLWNTQCTPPIECTPAHLWSIHFHTLMALHNRRTARRPITSILSTNRNVV
jgi:hypothetical protein